LNTFVIYDSVYGNTQKIAQAISFALGSSTKLLRISEVNLTQIAAGDLVFIGGPTQGGRPTKPMQEFLSNIPANSLRGVNVVVFDTRLKSKLVGVFGYAAGKIADAVKKNGANIKGSPAGFLVKGGRGPLVDKEIERATAWSKAIAAT
jgi:flavodoxin I